MGQSATAQCEAQDAAPLHGRTLPYIPSNTHQEGPRVHISDRPEHCLPATKGTQP